MELINLRDLLQHEIEDLYSAEEQIIEALPKMVEKAGDRELKKALNEHLRVTKEQKNRLDKVMSLMKLKENEKENKGFFERIFGGKTKCKGTEGLITEGEKMMGENMDPKVMDAAIIASAQKIEHYEISGYGTARAYARELGLNEVAKLLEMTLNEEYKADDMLTSLALNKVNVEAEKGGSKLNGKGGKNNSGGVRNGIASKSKKPAIQTKKSVSKSRPSKTAGKKVASKKRTVKS